MVHSYNSNQRITVPFRSIFFPDVVAQTDRKRNESKEVSRAVCKTSAWLLKLVFFHFRLGHGPTKQTFGYAAQLENAFISQNILRTTWKWNGHERNIIAANFNWLWIFPMMWIWCLYAMHSYTTHICKQFGIVVVRLQTWAKNHANAHFHNGEAVQSWYVPMACIWLWNSLRSTGYYYMLVYNIYSPLHPPPSHLGLWYSICKALSFLCTSLHPSSSLFFTVYVCM